MSAAATTPLTVTPEAAAQVAKLGIQAELKKMIEHAQKNVPGLRCIEVLLEPRYDEPGEEPAITILATRGDSHLENDPIGWELARWQVTTFPPDVCRHLGITIHYETSVSLAK